MLLQLLPELQEKVLGYLDAEDLRSLACCSTVYNQLAKKYLWHTVKLTESQLLKVDVNNIEKLKNFKHTRNLHIHILKLCAYDEEARKKKVRNYNQILKYCQPKVIYSSFMMTDMLSCICKIDNLVELSMGCTGIDNANIHDVCNSLKELKVLRIKRTVVTDHGFIHLNKLILLEELEISGCRITDAALSYVSSLVKLKILYLSFCKKITNEGFAYLSNMTLKDLYLFNSDVSDGVLPYINSITSLQYLNVGQTQITDIGLKSFWKFEHLTVLHVVSNSNITDLGLQYLARIVSLKKFHLCENRNVTDAGILHLSHLTNLCELDLGDCKNITGEAFSSFKNVPALRRLVLSSCKLRDDTLRYIGAIVSLQYLDICKNSLTNQGVKQLGNLKLLRELNINDCKGVTGEALSNFSNLTLLERLHLSWCNVTDKDVCYIGAITSLRYLRIGDNPISDKGLKSLDRLQRLIELDISDCTSISDVGISYLSLLISLRKLHISNTKVSDACISHIRDSNLLKVIKRY